MGRAIGSEKVPPQGKPFSDTNQEEAAEYICHLLDSVQKISENKGLTLLACLVGLARDEARRHF